MSNDNRFILNDYDLSDTIDLSTALSNDISKLQHCANTKKRNSYNISLESITDEELQNITRSLITPIPFQWSMETKKSKANALFIEVPTFRSESAAIFNDLNNDDVLSVDFAQSDLKDFIDPVLLEGVISRPVSRAPLQPQRDTQVPMDQIGDPQTISRRHLLNSMEIKSADDINILTTEYDKMDLKKNSDGINIYNTKKANFENHNNDHMLSGKRKHKQNYIAEGKLPINHVIRKYQINSNNSKRHSLDVNTLTTLRRDNVESLQNRHSLTSDHISKVDDITTKKSLNKSTKSYNKIVSEKQAQTSPSFNSNKSSPPRLVSKSERKEAHNAKFQSNLPQFEKYIYHDLTFAGPSSNHSKTNKHSLREVDDLKSGMERNRTVRRYRSVSFPDQSKNKQIYNACDGKESNTDTLTTFPFTPKHYQPGQNERQTLTVEKPLKIDQHRNVPEFERLEISFQGVNASTTHHFERNVSELSSSSSSSSSSLLPTRRLFSKQNKYDLNNQVISQHDNERYKITNNTSVTESAKNILATIRQRRASSYQQQMLHDESMKTNLQHKEKSYQSTTRFESGKDSNKSPVSSGDSSNIFDEIPATNAGKLYKTYSPTTQNKKHSYVTRRSTLNRGTDRYISVLGKPSPSIRTE